MANFTEMKYLPEDGLKNRARFRTAPGSEEEARSQLQDMFDQITAYVNETLLPQLRSAATGGSGAERIGSAAIDGLDSGGQQPVSPVTVRDQIALLQQKFDTAVKGQIKVIETIGNGEFNGAKLTDGTVAGTKLADGAVTADKIAVGAINASILSDGSLGGSKLADEAVTTEEIWTGAVSEEKLGADSVTHTKIKDSQVIESKLADNAVTTQKIMNGNVTASKIADGAITGTKIAGGAVTEEKLGGYAVTTGKLGIINSITMASGDTISYDNSTDILKLNVSGCMSVQLAPIVFGTGVTPPSGVYPKGTLYIQYLA